MNRGLERQIGASARYQSPMIRRRSRSYSSRVIAPESYAFRKSASCCPTLASVRDRLADHHPQPSTMAVTPTVRVTDNAQTSEVANLRIDGRGEIDFMNKSV